MYDSRVFHCYITSCMGVGDYPNCCTWRLTFVLGTGHVHQLLWPASMERAQWLSSVEPLLPCSCCLAMKEGHGRPCRAVRTCSNLHLTCDTPRNGCVLGKCTYVVPCIWKWLWGQGMYASFV